MQAACESARTDPIYIVSATSCARRRLIRDVSGIKCGLDTHRTLCEASCMATNLDIDQTLLKEAVSVGRHRSKKAAVTEALQEYIARHKQQRIVEILGTVEYSQDYDYRKHRKRA